MTGSRRQHSQKEGLRGCLPCVHETLEFGAAAKEDRAKTMDLRGHQGKAGLKEFTRWTRSPCAHVAPSIQLGLGIGPSIELC